MKFNLKSAMHNVKEPAMAVGLITAAAIGAQKFDLKDIMKTTDPNKWFIKHQGALKVGGVLLTFMMWKKMPMMMKYLFIGLAVQGAIQELRVLTTGEDGKTPIDQIGANNMDEGMRLLAERIRANALEGPEESGTGVGNGETTVGAMGMGMGLGNAMGGVWDVWQPGGAG